MDHLAVERVHDLMGRSLAPLAGVVDGTYELAPSGWWWLSGGPSADVNMVMVHGDDPQFLRRGLAGVDRLGCPAILMLGCAGAGLAGVVPDGWSAVGTMPVMTADLDSVEHAADDRVRRADGGDHRAVTTLMAAAFDLPVAICKLLTDSLYRMGTDAGFWVLEDDGEPVSTVLAQPVEDSVSIWCMSTPAAHARQGFGRALLSTVLDRHRTAGAAVGLLGATPAGLPLYEATGWVTVEEVSLFVNGESVQFADGH